MGTKEKIGEYVRQWEGRGYEAGIPDEAPAELERNGLVPSYRRICIAILKNDHPLKTLGFTPTKSKYYGILKRIEIDARPKKYGKQLKINYENLPK